MTTRTEVEAETSGAEERADASTERAGDGSTDGARERLARAQHELMAALVGGGEIPPGFDQARVRAAAGSLHSKRYRSLEAAWPSLPAIIGAPFHALFHAFERDVTLPEYGGPLADGRAFIAWLERAGEAVPVVARLNAVGIDLRFHFDDKGLRPRRWPFAVTTARVGPERRLVFGFRLPFVRGRWIPLPPWAPPTIEEPPEQEPEENG